MDADSAAKLPLLVAGLAFVLAFIFGAVANRVNFCTMGAIADIVNFGDWKRMRMWVLAIAVAIVGSAVLALAGQVDLAKSIYTAPRIAWVSAIVGGFLFGFGMTLASGCGSKTLIRAGAGNLKSWIVLFMVGIAAYMTLRGLFAVWRTSALDIWRIDLAGLGAKTSDLPAILGALGLPAASLWLPFVVAAALAVFVFKSRDFRVAPELVIGGVVIGLLVVGGWYLTGHLGYLAEDPATLEEKFFGTNSNRLESFSFVAPIAYTLELLMFWSDQSRIVTFGVAARAGDARGLRRLRARGAVVPLGRLRLGRGRRQSHGRRRADGLWRGHRAGLHDRPGDHRRLHAGGRFVPRAGGDHRRLRGRRPLPGMAPLEDGVGGARAWRVKGR